MAGRSGDWLFIVKQRVDVRFQWLSVGILTKEFVARGEAVKTITLGDVVALNPAVSAHSSWLGRLKRSDELVRI